MKRAWLFTRDFLSEVRGAWSLARMWDCERHGGHRWGEQFHDPDFLQGLGHRCSRCGCWESVPPTPFATASQTQYTFRWANLEGKS